jgi:hypothetical protein
LSGPNPIVVIAVGATSRSGRAGSVFRRAYWRMPNRRLFQNNGFESDLDRRSPCYQPVLPIPRTSPVGPFRISASAPSRSSWIIRDVGVATILMSKHRGLEFFCTPISSAALQPSRVTTSRNASYEETIRWTINFRLSTCPCDRKRGRIECRRHSWVLFPPSRRCHRPRRRAMPGITAALPSILDRLPVAEFSGS